MNPLQTRIVNFLAQSPDAAFTVSELARHLRVKLADKRQLRLALKALAKDGPVAKTQGGRSYSYQTPKTESAETTKELEQKTEKSVAKGLAELIEEFQLPASFPPKVLAEAASIPTDIPSDELQRRRDLRNQVTVTIDGENAKDFDDAISIEDIGRERIRLRVSIADVSYYVAPGSIIDKEAYSRSTSVYFPDRVFPMLPEKLSNQVCSLVPDEDRLAFTAEIDFDMTGAILRTDFYKSIIRSRHRLTYTQVAKTLVDRDETTRHELRHILPHLELMYKLFLILRAARLERGSLDFDLPEPEIVMDMEEGRIETIVKAIRTQAHMLIEEFMIAANEAVARFLSEREVPMIYRIHDEPNRDGLKELQRSLHNLGYSLKIPKKAFSPKQFGPIIKKAEGTAESRMISTLILRSLAKAIYDIENKGHFGLASTCYTHFTSPIRRYPDLMVHRILNDVLVSNAKKTEGKKLSRQRRPRFTIDLRRLVRTAEHCSIRERAAMEIEWAVRDLLQAIFITEHIGKTFSGIVSGVTRFGVFIELSDYFVNGLIHIRNLEDDYYHFIESSHTLIGKRTGRRFRIGDLLQVKVGRVDIEKRWVDLELAPPSDY